MEGDEETCYWGHFTESPETAIVMGSSIVSDGDLKSYNNHHQISSKAEYNHYGGGGCSGKVTKTFKSGGFVDGRNGNHVYKKEVDYDSSFKVNDKRHGITTHYETQVKHKQTTTYANPSAKSSGGKSCSKTGYTFAKPSRSSGAVQFKNAGGTSKVSASAGVKCEVVARYTNSGKSSGGVARGSSSRAYGGSKKCDYSYY